MGNQGLIACVDGNLSSGMIVTVSQSYPSSARYNAKAKRPEETNLYRTSPEKFLFLFSSNVAYVK